MLIAEVEKLIFEEVNEINFTKAVVNALSVLAILIIAWTFFLLI
jgi:hypothetical protein